jgi:hypothetical protein
MAEEHQRPRCYGGKSDFLTSSNCNAQPAWHVEAAYRFANTCSPHMAVAVNYVLTGSQQHSDSAPRDGGR